MARTASIATCLYDHITWNGDCLVIHLPRHKGDPEGLRSYPKHIYANSADPLLCPVLALGLHVVSTSFREDTAVFAGGCIDIKYCK